MTDVMVRPAAPADRDPWTALFRDYAATGELTIGDAIIERVWGWICDPAAQTQCWVADAGERLIGFVHFREVERPITGDLTGYIDDLYVAPSGRGRRLSLTLIERVLSVGSERGWSHVRWTTRPGNAPANHLYALVAHRVPLNVYVADVPIID